jgi:hypothetical protein
LIPVVNVDVNGGDPEGGLADNVGLQLAGENPLPIVTLATVMFPATKPLYGMKLQVSVPVCEEVKGNGKLS